MGHRAGIMEMCLEENWALFFFSANFQFYEIPQDVYNQKHINKEEWAFLSYMHAHTDKYTPTD